MKISAFTRSCEGRQLLSFPGIELEKGKIYCIIGANGSGKSTFARILSGIIPADHRARVLESGVSVGYMPQKNHAFRMKLRANLLLANRDAKRAQALMQALQIDHLADQRANRLSGGETARMALARLMMQRYDLVILDEPTAAMDAAAAGLAEAAIRRYIQETNCALVLITHSLRQARRLADEVLFFHEGRLLESGPKEKLLAGPQNSELRQFLDFYGG